MSKIKVTAKQITPILQFGGLGLLVYGVMQGHVLAGIIGIMVALVGGVMWKITREDIQHESRSK